MKPEAKANFDKIFARCARRQISNQILKDLHLSQGALWYGAVRHHRGVSSRRAGIVRTLSAKATKHKCMISILRDENRHNPESSATPIVTQSSPMPWLQHFCPIPPISLLLALRFELHFLALLVLSLSRRPTTYYYRQYGEREARDDSTCDLAHARRRSGYTPHTGLYPQGSPAASGTYSSYR